MLGLHFSCLCLTNPEIMQICQIFSPFLVERGRLCSCSVHVLDVAALIHIVRSGRAATFNDCIHMHLVPYLKSQITSSANYEMNKITLPSRHRIGNSIPGGLRPSTLPLSHGGSSAPHNTYEWSLRVIGRESFVTLQPECHSGGRTRDLLTFQADRFITTPSAPHPPPKLLQLGVQQFQREIIKNVCPKINENKITPYDSVLSNRTCAMLDFQIHDQI